MKLQDDRDAKKLHTFTSVCFFTINLSFPLQFSYTVWKSIGVFKSEKVCNEENLHVFFLIARFIPHLIVLSPSFIHLGAQKVHESTCCCVFMALYKKKIGQSNPIIDIFQLMLSVEIS